MKNTLQTIALLFLISLIGCEKETNQINEGSPRAPFSNKMYTVDELPNDIKEYYYQKKGQEATKFGQKTESTTAAVFSENSIVGNTDLQNNSNYSIGYVFEDTPKHIIYNLVINKDSNGNIVGKRFKYICNPSDYDNFKSHNFDFKYFVGTTEVVTVPSNSNSKSDNGYPPCIDGTPCIRIIPSAPTGSLGNGGPPSSPGNNAAVLGYNTSAGTGNYSVTFGGTTYYSGGGSNGGATGGGATGGGSLDCINHDFCIPDSYGGYNYSCGDLIPAHHHEKNTTTAADEPCDPCANNPLPSGIVPINLAPYYLQNIKAVIPLTKGQWVYLANNDAVVDQLWHVIDFSPAVLTPEYKQFWSDLVEYLKNNPTMSWDIVMNNRTSFDTNQGEVDNYSQGGYDTNTYDTFNPQQQSWPSIAPVIPQNKFVGWNINLHPNWHCMDYSKEQLRVMGYQISSYYATGQTFQIYTAQNGVNNTALSQGLSYLKYALSNGIPVIVGVDDAPGHSGNLDSTTDHFIVIVGMGTDSNGKYFRFYDNATGALSNGTSTLNKLYYNSSTKLISGTSQAIPYSTGLNYTITMIRKSKSL